MFGKKDKPKTELQRKLERLRIIGGLPSQVEEQLTNDFVARYSFNTKITMPDPATLVSCVEEVVPAPAKATEYVDPIALDTMILNIKMVLEPVLHASEKDGVYIENEKYSVTLMKSGMIRIYEKTEE